MSARTTIDLDRVHPVSGGQWHRVAPLQRLPRPGEQITMLCGQVEEAKNVSTTEQTVTVQTWVALPIAGNKACRRCRPIRV